MRNVRALLGILVCWLACAAASARADNISWNYGWSGTTEVLNNTGGGVQFIPSFGSGTNGEDGVPAVMLKAFGPTGVVTNGAYSLTMHLTDQASGTTADLSFSGVLSGTTDQGLLNQFNSPLTQQAMLGGNNYGVVIGLFAAPGPTGSGVQGMIGANVMVVPGSGGGNPTPPPVTSVPEPATLTLAGLAAGALGLRWGWRRRAGRG